MTKKEFQYYLGQEIARIRKQKKLTQSDFGFLIDIEKQSVNRIEKGKTNVSTYLLYTIANALDTDLIDLLDFVKNKK